MMPGEQSDFMTVVIEHGQPPNALKSHLRGLCSSSFEQNGLLHLHNSATFRITRIETKEVVRAIRILVREIKMTFVGSIFIY